MKKFKWVTRLMTLVVIALSAAVIFLWVQQAREESAPHSSRRATAGQLLPLNLKLERKILEQLVTPTPQPQ